jgi:hypothetical protein
MYPLARYVVGFTPCLCILAAAIVLLLKSPRADGRSNQSANIANQGA